MAAQERLLMEAVDMEEGDSYALLTHDELNAGSHPICHTKRSHHGHRSISTALRDPRVHRLVLTLVAFVLLVALIAVATTHRPNSSKSSHADDSSGDKSDPSDGGGNAHSTLVETTTVMPSTSAGDGEFNSQLEIFFCDARTAVHSSEYVWDYDLMSPLRLAEYDDACMCITPSAATQSGDGILKSSSATRSGYVCRCSTDEPPVVEWDHSTDQIRVYGINSESLSTSSEGIQKQPSHTELGCLTVVSLASIQGGRVGVEPCLNMSTQPRSPSRSQKAAVDAQRWLMHGEVSTLSTVIQSQLPGQKCLGRGTGPCGPRGDSFCFSNTLASHMVLQRAPRRARIFGYSLPHDQISCQLNDKHFTAVAERDATTYLREWVVELDPIPAGGPYQITCRSQSTGDIQTLRDVLFGDVFLCSGQSNMEMTLRKSSNNSEELSMAENHYRHIRVMTVGLGTWVYDHNQNQSMLGTVQAPWSRPTHESIGGWLQFSAVCWYTGRHLADRLGNEVPIGLISSAWGGTCLDSWTQQHVVNECQLSPSPITEPTLGGLFETMIYPFHEMQITGMVWYQGEDNLGTEDIHGCSFFGPDMYSCLFKESIQYWRHIFDQDLFFGFVQLAAYTTHTAILFDNTALPLIREAQATALTLPNTAMVTAADLGDPTSPFTDIHPRHKEPIGDRMARAMMHLIYGEKDLVYRGPTAASVVVEPVGPTLQLQRPDANGTLLAAVVSFEPDSIGIGLRHRPVSCPPDGINPTFHHSFCVGWQVGTVARGNGTETTWTGIPAEISLDRTQVILPLPTDLEAEQVKHVRLGFGNWPLIDVYNSAGLPTLPFRMEL